MEIVADFACKTGECPVWHPTERALYWVDIPRGRMFRYDPATGRSEQVFEGGQVGGLVVQEDGSMLQFMEEGRVQIWKDGKTAVVCEGIEAERGIRFNDAIADPLGRALAGTMPDPNGQARLYRFGIDGRPELLLNGIGQSNGMAFTADGGALFHTDTKRKRISRYRYGERLVLETSFSTEAGEDIVPDGLAMDKEGRLYSAQWGGSRVSVYDESGKQLDEIAIPTSLVSSIAFGGEAWTDLYVTTAGGDERDENGETAGALLRTKATEGRPPNLSRVEWKQKLIGY